MDSNNKNKLVSQLFKTKISEYLQIKEGSSLIPVIRKNLKKDGGNPDSPENILKYRFYASISKILSSYNADGLTISEIIKKIILDSKASGIEDLFEELPDMIKIVYSPDFKIDLGNGKSYNLKDKHKDDKLKKIDELFIKKEMPKTSKKKGNKYKHKNSYGLYDKSQNSKINQNPYYDIDELVPGAINTYSEGGTNITEILINQKNNDNYIKSSKFNPSFGFIMVNDPSLRVGSKNSLELSAFLNLINTIELSKCQPFFNINFILPGSVENMSGNIFKTASITQFLDGTPIYEKDTTETYNTLSANFERRVNNSTTKQNAVSTNISLFTMPQTINNFDEDFIGSEDDIVKRVSQKYTRNNPIHDAAKPFLTVKNFSVDIAPTQGLMSFKTGKLSLVLHDKTRMTDIAPFIKPDLFGSFGAEIAIEYGWFHPEDDGSNVLANLFNESRILEKFIITNSSFSIDNTGQVNIDLSIAMRGPIDIRSITLKGKKNKTINSAKFNAAITKYQELKTAYSTRLQVDFEESYTSYLRDAAVSFESSGNSDVLKNPKLIVKNIKKAKRKIKNLKNLKSNQSMMFFLYDTLATLNKAGGSLIIQNPFNVKFTSTDTIENDTGTMKKFTDDPFIAASSGTSNIKHSTAHSTLLTALIEVIEEFNKSYIAKVDANNKQDQTIANSILNFDKKEDPFYNKDWLKKYTKFSNIRNNRYTVKERVPVGYTNASTPQSNKSKGSKEGYTDYITFGSFLTSLIGSRLVVNRGFNEVQIVSYTANGKCGLMSNLNIASFLLRKKELSDFIIELFKGGVELTLESIITQVINKFIISRKQICYGISDLYKYNSAGNVVNLSDSEKKQQQNLEETLRKIYGTIADIDPRQFKQEVDINEFVMPKIKATFDTLTDRNDLSKTICRISIFDRNDDPFRSLNRIMSKLGNQEIEDAALKINKKMFDLKIKSPKSSEKSEQKFYDESWQIIQDLIDKGIIVEQPKKSGKYRIKSFFNKGSFKNEIKRIMPSIVYGSQNSAVLDASVTTVNEAKLNTVYITRSDRNNENSDLNENFMASVKFQQDLPLKILPSQASVTLFGCPFVNFAQYMFLDFHTGTTIDNKYAVTGIKHDISPGKFTTSLTLSFGDSYSKYENIAHTFTKIARKRTGKQQEVKVDKTNKTKTIEIKDYRKSKIITDTYPAKELVFEKVSTINNKSVDFKFDIYNYFEDQLETVSVQNTNDTIIYKFNLFINKNFFAASGNQIAGYNIIIDIDLNKFKRSAAEDYVEKISNNITDPELRKLAKLNNLLIQDGKFQVDKLIPVGLLNIFNKNNNSITTLNKKQKIKKQQNDLKTEFDEFKMYNEENFSNNDLKIADEAEINQILLDFKNNFLLEFVKNYIVFELKAQISAKETSGNIEYSAKDKSIRLSLKNKSKLATFLNDKSNIDDLKKAIQKPDVQRIGSSPKNSIKKNISKLKKGIIEKFEFNEQGLCLKYVSDYKKKPIFDEKIYKYEDMPFIKALLEALQNK
tara:strand:+ start:33038 stop:37552 length:4515 start_codon:yes stop_codon:yes gene_type:complete